MDKIIITTPSELETLITDSVRKAFSEQNNNCQTDSNTQLLSVEQACAYLKLAKQTLYGFTSKQEIPFLKKGKKLYFKQPELEAWVNAGKQKSTDELNKK